MNDHADRALDLAGWPIPSDSDLKQMAAKTAADYLDYKMQIAITTALEQTVERPLAKGDTMNGHLFRFVLDAFMCADPWPSESSVGHADVESALNEEARRRGYENWVVAYHEFAI